MCVWFIPGKRRLGRVCSNQSDRATQQTAAHFFFRSRLQFIWFVCCCSSSLRLLLLPFVWAAHSFVYRGHRATQQLSLMLMVRPIRCARCAILSMVHLCSGPICACCAFCWPVNIVIELLFDWDKRFTCCLSVRIWSGSFEFVRAKWISWAVIEKIYIDQSQLDTPLKS